MRIRLTSKRQATFPKQVCDALGIGPGDEVTLERRTFDGEIVWVLRPGGPDWSWVGAASVFAEGRSHEWADVEASIAAGAAQEASEG